MDIGISAGTRKELIRALLSRYRKSPKNDRKRIRDEFLAKSGYDLKHGARILVSISGFILKVNR